MEAVDIVADVAVVIVVVVVVVVDVMDVASDKVGRCDCNRTGPANRTEKRRLEYDSADCSNVASSADNRSGRRPRRITIAEESLKKNCDGSSQFFS